MNVKLWMGAPALSAKGSMSNLLARIKRLFRLRFAVLYPLGVYLVLFTTPDDRSTLVGVSVMAAGMFMRLW
jgi:hypothetical protein